MPPPAIYSNSSCPCPRQKLQLRFVVVEPDRLRLHYSKCIDAQRKLPVFENRRGRPPGSGLNDEDVLDRIEMTLTANPSLSVRRAITAEIGPDDTASLRRLERKLAKRRKSKAPALSGTDELPRSSYRERAVTEQVFDLESFKRYMASKGALPGQVDLNAHEFAFDHRTIAHLCQDQDTHATRMVTSTAGSMAVLSPPDPASWPDRAVALAWEQSSQAVCLSPEEKAAWDATDGQYWRLMNDWWTPWWRKVLPLWHKPDLSMTAALTRIAYQNGWLAAERQRMGRAIDFAAKLSSERREPIPASKMRSLPARILALIWRRLRVAAFRLRYPRARPLIQGRDVVSSAGDQLVFMPAWGSFKVDSVGHRYMDVDIYVRAEGSGMRIVHRAAIHPGCLSRRIRIDPDPVDTREPDEPIGASEAADTILEIEAIADWMARPALGRMLHGSPHRFPG